MNCAHCQTPITGCHFLFSTSPICRDCAHTFDRDGVRWECQCKQGCKAPEVRCSPECKSRHPPTGWEIWFVPFPIYNLATDHYRLEIFRTPHGFQAAITRMANKPVASRSDLTQDQVIDWFKNRGVPTGALSAGMRQMMRKHDSPTAHGPTSP